ncbi:photosynthetic reaction center cytochrome PufC [Alsobacter sp. R-9]
MKSFGWTLALGTVGLFIGGWMVATAGWSLPPAKSQQIGYRGVAMVQTKDASVVAANAKITAPPPPYVASPEGPKAKTVYPNLQVLGDLSEDQFNGLMASFAEWVGGEQGCAYCHNPENMGDYSRYQLIVARRMIQMTRTINTEWKNHVGATGVTCYTCHGGNGVPKNVWYKETGLQNAKATQWLGYEGGQNLVAKNADLTSLPYDALSEFLLGDKPIRVHTLTALPSGNKSTIMDTEHTWALMMHMSQSLGQNCTFCHNSRAFNAWDESPPQRVTAFYGIRMARAVNKTYLEPLTSTFPANRLGKTGDVAKVGCATCHQGLNKPLNGAQVLKDYMAELGTKP